MIMIYITMSGCHLMMRGKWWVYVYVHRQALSPEDV